MKVRCSYMNGRLLDRKRATRVVDQDFTARVTAADTTAPASANSRADIPRTAASCFAMSWNADPATSANTSHVMAFCWVFVIQITPYPHRLCDPGGERRSCTWSHYYLCS